MDHVALSSHCVSPPRPGTRNPVERTWNYANRFQPPRARTPLTDPAPARDRRAPRTVGPSSSSPAPPRDRHGPRPRPVPSRPGSTTRIAAIDHWRPGPARPGRVHEIFGRPSKTCLDPRDRLPGLRSRGSPNDLGAHPTISRTRPAPAGRGAPGLPTPARKTDANGEERTDVGTRTRTGASTRLRP